MTLTAVPCGWINTNLVIENNAMITQERKSKYKHKVMISPGWAKSQHGERIEWCTQTFGPGGRSKKFRWRFGWTDKVDTYYFKSSKDAMLFTLRWSDA